MMKIASACCLLAASPAVLAGGVGADSLSGAVALASEQVLRGLRQSNGDASVSVDLNYHFDRADWVAGAGFVTLGRDERRLRTLVNVSIARGWQLDGDWSAQAGAAHYAYPGAAERAFDYDELSVSLGWRGRLGAAVTWSPDTTRRDAAGTRRRGRAMSWELSLRQPLAGPWTLDAGIGWRDLRALHARGYPYASMAVGCAAGPWQLVGSFITSRAAQRGVVAANAAGDRWVASLVRDF